MQFIRNIEALKKNSSDSIEFEYEVITDALIIGECDYGPYYFTIWEFVLNPKEKIGYKRKLCLRIKQPQKQVFPYGDEVEESKEKESEFYHGGGIAEELVILASLFLRRRLRLGRIVRMDNEAPTQQAAGYPNSLKVQ